MDREGSFAGASRLVAAAILAVAACSGKTCSSSCARNAGSQQLAGDDVIKAKVGETTISQYDVMRAIETSLSDQASASRETQEKVLESLVTSRALALARERELDAQGQAELAKAVARYREQLLVEQYIAEHHPPQPIAQEELTRYYAEHASSFGARSVRSFELLSSPLDTGGKSPEAIANLTSAAQTPDWKAAAAKGTKSSKTAIEYQTGTASDQVLHPRLRHALAGLPLNQASSTIIIEQRAYVLRVTGESRNEPRPLSEVSDVIRKSLAARALKEAVAKASSEIRKSTSIEYPSTQ